VGGLPWLNPADVRGVKPEGRKKKKKKKQFIFYILYILYFIYFIFYIFYILYILYFIFLSCWAQVARRYSARSPMTNKNKNKNKTFFFPAGCRRPHVAPRGHL
jgi:ABC-type phosphate transport system permease subunit